MTRRGESAHALGIAITGSAIGGIAGTLMMIFLSPPFASFALKFDQPEFFAATVGTGVGGDCQRQHDGQYGLAVYRLICRCYRAGPVVRHASLDLRLARAG